MYANSAYANSMGVYDNPPATAAQRQPEVSCEMERLTTQCETLDKQFSELETKLMTVLAQRGEGNVSDQKNPEPVRVPLAQAIHDRVAHLSQLSDRLQSIINRIEV
jgi:hypothetical protein